MSKKLLKYNKNISVQGIMKNILFQLCFFLSSSFAIAQELFDYEQFNGISIGGGALLTSDISGGFFDFGFNLYDNEEFSIRNYIELNGGGTGREGGFGGGGIRERILFIETVPLTSNVAFRPYGGFDVGVSFLAGADNNSGSVFEGRGFGGFEIAGIKKNKSKFSVFVEAGGFGRACMGGYDNPQLVKGGAFFSLGGRKYF